MESTIKSLQIALAQKNLKKFETTLNSIALSNLSQTNYFNLSDLMVKAFKENRFYSNNFNISLIAQLKNKNFKDLTSKIGLISTISELSPGALPLAFEEFSEFIENFHPLEISALNSSQILSILLKNLYFPEKILNFIEKNIVLSNFPEGKLSNKLTTQFIWAYTENSRFNEELWKIIDCKILPYRFLRFSFRDRIQTVHALSLIQNYEISAEILKLFFSIDTNHLNNIDFFEYFMIVNYLCLFKSISPPYSSKDFSNIMEKYEKISDSSCLSDTKSSQIHKDVENHLKKLGIEFFSEYLIEKPFFLIVDIFIQPNLVIEVQGPSHYLKPNLLPSKRTTAKLEVLKKIGFTVKTVPYFEWIKLDDLEKTQFLNRILLNKPLS